MTQKGHKQTYHGLSRTPEYRLWIAIKVRCLKTFAQSEYYYDRGITVCDEWIDSPVLFIDWCKSNGYKKGLQIDRNDNDKGYSPENCRFVTNEINQLNKRPLQSNNQTGLVGTHYCKRDLAWRAMVGNKGKTITVGRYTNPVDAAVARDSYIINNKLKLMLNFQYQRHQLKNRVAVQPDNIVTLPQ